MQKVLKKLKKIVHDLKRHSEKHATSEKKLRRLLQELEFSLVNNQVEHSADEIFATGSHLDYVLVKLRTQIK